MSASEEDGGSKTQFWVTIAFVVGAVLLELGVIAAQYSSSPGYISTLVTTGLGITISLIAIGWQVLGFAWLFSPVKSVVGFIVKVLLVGALCVFPVFLWTTLGPACITITQAIGPIMQETK